MASVQSVRTIYQTVVDDVVNGVREAFLDEGMDESILLELKQLWENKLQQSKAVDSNQPASSAHSGVHSGAHSGVPSAAQGHESTATQNYPAHPVATRQAIQQRHQLQQQQQAIPVHTMVPPAAHQGSNQSQHQSYNLQLIQGSAHQMTGPTHQMQYTNLTPMSNAANTAVMALPPGFQHQLAQGGRIALPNGQVVQFVQNLGSLPVAQSNSGAESKPTNMSLPGQLDGVGDSSSDEEEEEEDNDDDDEVNDDNDEAPGEEEEPLNSEDDVSDSDPTEVFDAENVVVCQFDKINRSKNKWKFHLKDGIMNLNGKDYVFQKASGDAEW